MARKFIFDVNDPPSELSLAKKTRRRKFDDDLGIVNANLVKLPRKFVIVNEDVRLDALLRREKITYLPGKYTYTLEYDGPDKTCYIDQLKPFLVYFHDSKTLDFNDNCYVANFHKTFTYSGTQIICTILKFLKCLGSQEVSLYDGSTIDSNGHFVSLSLIKLIELGRTFYNKFGFRREFVFSLPHSFGTRENLEIQFSQALQDVMKIRVDTITEYHRNIFRFLSDVFNGTTGSDDLSVKIGGDKIDYYMDFGGQKHKGGMELHMIISILKKSLEILNLNLTEGTLHEVVVKAVATKNNAMLTALLDIGSLPVVLKIKDGIVVSGSKFLKPINLLSILSHGQMSLNLSKVKVKDLCMKA